MNPEIFKEGTPVTGLPLIVLRDFEGENKKVVGVMAAESLLDEEIPVERTYDIKVEGPDYKTTLFTQTALGIVMFPYIQGTDYNHIFIEESEVKA